MIFNDNTTELGNCLYVAGDYARAKEIFLEAGTVLNLPLLTFPVFTALLLFIYSDLSFSFHLSFPLSFHSFLTLHLPH